MKIITGRASKDIDAPVLKRIREIKAEDPFAPVIVITMRQATFITEKYIMSKLGVRGMIGIDVISFDKLTQKITDSVSGRAYKTISNIGKCILFCSILRQHPKDLDKLSKSGRISETSKGLAELYSEFGNMDITAEDLKSVLGTGVVSEEKLKEIVFAFERFTDWVRGHEILAFDRTSLAIENVGKSAYIKSAHVFVTGCDTMTEQMIRFMQELDKYAKSVTVSMLWSDRAYDADVFALPSVYLNEFRQNGAVTEAAEADRKISDDIKHIEKHLFAYPYETAESKGDIMIAKCGNPDREIMACCERAAELIRSGYSPSDIGIVASDIGSYAKYIKKHFGDSRIPYFLDEKRSLAENPLSDFILSALRLAVGRVTSDRLLVHINAGFLGTEKERRLISTVISGRIKNPYKLKKALVDPAEEAARRSCVMPVFAFIDKAHKAGSQSRLIDLIEDYLKNCGAEKKMESMISEQRRLGYDDAADYYSQVGEEISEVFSQLRLIASGAADRNLLYDMIVSAFEARSISIIPVKSEAVFFGDIGLAKIRMVRCLMMLGLNEGSVPDYEETPGILTDNEKNSIFLSIKEREYPSLMSRQKLFLYELVTAPLERLELFYHISDGKDVIPESVLISKIKDIFTAASLKVSQDSEIIGKSLRSNALDEAKDDVGRMLRKIDSGSGYGFIPDLMADAESNGILRRFEGLGTEEIHDRIDPKTAAELFPQKGSVTRFEDFYLCPYKHFIERGIKPFETKTPDMQADEVGSFLHSLFDRFFAKLEGKGISIKDAGTDEIAAMTGEIAGEIAKEMAEEKGKEVDDGEGTALVEILKSEADEYLAFLKKEKELAESDVDATELEFDLEIGESVLTGRIDRIDTCVVNGKRYFSITDYKTGKKKAFSYYDLYKGLKLQLAVYSIAASKLYPDAKPAGAGYVYIDEGKMDETGSEASFAAAGMHSEDIEIVKTMYGFKGNAADAGGSVPGLDITINSGNGRINGRTVKRLVSEAEFNTIMRYAEILVERAYEQTRDGIVSAVPAENSDKAYPCQYCSYRALCGSAVDGSGPSVKKNKIDVMPEMEKEVRRHDETH